MDPGQVGANGESAARLVVEVIGRETEFVLLLCMGGILVVGRHLGLMSAEIMIAMVREAFFGTILIVLKASTCSLEPLGLPGMFFLVALKV